MGWGFRGVSLGCRVLAAVVVVGVMAGCGSATQAASTAPVTAVSTGPTPRIASASPTAASGSGVPGGPSGVAVATATVPADVPLVGHNMAVGEKPPLEPAAALAHTQDGAIAFAKFWIQTVDWGYATTSSAYGRLFTDPSCATCLLLFDKVDAWQRKGDFYLGGRVTVASMTPDGSTASHGSEMVLRAMTSVTGTEVVDTNYKYVAGEQAYPVKPVRLWLKWQSGWTVVDFGGV